MMNRTIWVAPILPVKMRYSEWWNGEFIRRLNSVSLLMRKKDPWIAKGIWEHLTIAESFDSSDEFFKDQLGHDVQVLNTLHTLVSQGQITKNDVILVLDSSTPGLVASYLQTHKPCRVVGVCHATALNTLDIFSKSVSRPYFDIANLLVYDAIVVASQYHKSKLWNALKNSRNSWVAPTLHLTKFLPENPQLTRYLSFFKDMSVPLSEIKTKSICVADRIDQQKVDLKFTEQVEQRLGIKITFLQAPHNKSIGWSDYYSKLEQHKVMLVTAKEETYGYQVQEAMRLGTVPICPASLCYPEFVPGSFLYRDLDSCCACIQQALDTPQLLDYSEMSSMDLHENSANYFWVKLYELLIGTDTRISTGVK